MKGLILVCCVLHPLRETFVDPNPKERCFYYSDISRFWNLQAFRTVFERIQVAKSSPEALLLVLGQRVLAEGLEGLEGLLLRVSQGDSKALGIHITSGTTGAYIKESPITVPQRVCGSTGIDTQAQTHIEEVDGKGGGKAFSSNCHLHVWTDSGYKSIEYVTDRHCEDEKDITLDCSKIQLLGDDCERVLGYTHRLWPFVCRCTNDSGHHEPSKGVYFPSIHLHGF